MAIGERQSYVHLYNVLINVSLDGDVQKPKVVDHDEDRNDGLEGHSVIDDDAIEGGMCSS